MGKEYLNGLEFYQSNLWRFLILVGIVWGIILFAFLLTGCASTPKGYIGRVITPSGEVYKVEQNKPGEIAVKTKEGEEISANTKSKSILDRIIDIMLLRTTQK